MVPTAASFSSSLSCLVSTFTLLYRKTVLYGVLVFCLFVFLVVVVCFLLVSVLFFYSFRASCTLSKCFEFR